MGVLAVKHALTLALKIAGTAIGAACAEKAKPATRDRPGSQNFLARFCGRLARRRLSVVAHMARAKPDGQPLDQGRHFGQRHADVFGAVDMGTRKRGMKIDRPDINSIFAVHFCSPAQSPFLVHVPNA
jgi:hypothetical protein